MEEWQLAKHRSVMKRDRQSKVRRVRNMSRKTRVKNAIKAVPRLLLRINPRRLRKPCRRPCRLFKASLPRARCIGKLQPAKFPV